VIDSRILTDGVRGLALLKIPSKKNYSWSQKWMDLSPKENDKARIIGIRVKSAFQLKQAKVMLLTPNGTETSLRYMD
jgi:hypothetical protein